MLRLKSPLVYIFDLAKKVYLTAFYHLFFKTGRKNNDLQKSETRWVFSRFFDIHGNLGNVKEKPTGKTCFSREKIRLAPRIYQTKFCLAAFL